MKKAAQSVTVPTTMGPGKAADVESYLAACPEPHRTTLEKLRASIRSVVPKETTEAISYGMPSFRRNSRPIRPPRGPSSFRRTSRCPPRW